MNTSVVHNKKKPFDVYIGRPGKWGNPIQLTEGMRREDCVRQYWDYLQKHPSLIEAARQELKGKVLGCWCAPQLCHGHVLAAVADGKAWDAYFPEQSGIQKSPGPKTMKCFSIRRPWSWLIFHSDPLKDIENRDWPSSYRGWLLIHAAKGCTKSEYSDAMEFCAQRNILCEWPALHEMEAGGIVGMVYMDGCVSESESPWFVGDYGFTLKNPQPMPFIPYRGQLGLFDVPTELLDQHWGEEKQEPETESGELLTEQLRQCIYRKDWTTYRILEHRIFEQIRDRLLQEVELAKGQARQSGQSDELSLMHAAHWAVRFNLNLTTTIRYLERLGLCKQGAADSYKDRYKVTEILKKAEEEGAVPGELAV